MSLQTRGSEMIDDYLRIEKDSNCSQSLLKEQGYEFFHLGDSFIVKTSNVTETMEGLSASSCMVEMSAFPVRQREKRACSDPNLMYQTYLDHTKVVEAWHIPRPASHQSFVYIVDEGIQGHEDIEVFMRYNVGNRNTTGTHALSVAGVVGATWNGMGSCGISDSASIVDVNLLSTTFISDVTEALAFGGPYAYWNGVFCNAWGPVDDGRCEDMGDIMNETMHHILSHGRMERGSVIVFAAGNGGLEENMNDDGYASHVGTIAVSAIHNNVHFFIGEWGSCITVSAPAKNILSLSSQNSYAYFHGSSAAAPIVAGIVSLLLSRFPNLGWRDVQDILMLSAAKTNDVYEYSPSGRRYSYLVGSGAADAAAAIRLAELWEPLPEWEWVIERVHVEGPTPIAVGVLVERKLVVEKFKLCIDSHSEIDGAKMEIQVISPEGTLSVLSKFTARVSAQGCSYRQKCFSSLKSWGEMGKGMWSISMSSPDPSEVEFLTLTVYGHAQGRIVTSCTHENDA